MTLPVPVSVGAMASGSGPISVPWGAHQAGDFALLVIETGTSLDVVETPAGWTAIGAKVVGLNNTTLGWLFYRFAASGAEANADAADPGDHWVGVILVYRGVNTTNPINAFAGAMGASAPTTVLYPTLFTTRPDCRIVNILFRAVDAAGPYSSAETNPTLANLVEQFDDGAVDGNGGGIVVITGEKAAKGYVDHTQATMVAVSGGHALVTLALAPGPSVACTVAGTVTINGAPAPDGGTVEVWDKVDDVLVATTAITGGAGAFSVDVPIANACIAVYDDGANRGVSAAGTPEASTFNITIGGGDANAPTITIVSPTPGVPPGQPGGFPADWETARDTPIVVEIADAAPGLAYACVVARFPGAPHEIVVYRRGAFRAGFATRSWSESLGNTLRLHCLPDGWWPVAGPEELEDITFALDAIDGAGNLAA